MAEQTLMMRVFKRLKTENRWEEAEPYRNELAEAAKARGLKGKDAQDYTYQELARKFPPINGGKPEQAIVEKPASEQKAGKQAKEEAKAEDAAQFSSSEQVAPLLSRAASDAEFSVRGLSEIPGNWPDLPPNAPLSAEVSWVQANRLRIVRESSLGVTVDLSKALTPAPSSRRWAGLKPRSRRTRSSWMWLLRRLRARTARRPRSAANSSRLMKSGGCWPKCWRVNAVSPCVFVGETSVWDTVSQFRCVPQASGWRVGAGMDRVTRMCCKRRGKGGFAPTGLERVRTWIAVLQYHTELRSALAGSSRNQGGIACVRVWLCTKLHEPRWRW